MQHPLFADRLLAWFDQHGRHDLPWQQQRSLYRVWLAEVMLQQTQVATVIPYYQRFLENFPDLASLAAATLDEVLARWAGLGYYTRARNLHRAALIMQQQHAGEFPQQYDEVLALPGIGPSTAGAILAQATGQRYPILDGNVKRVLCRYLAIEGWPGRREVEKQLWDMAGTLTPYERVADYTQAIMDLGATICSRSSPACERCPLNADCRALASDRVAGLPTARPRKSLPVKATRLLLLTNRAGEILLEKRPPTGIWGGLWSLPEAELETCVATLCSQRWGYKVGTITDRPQFRHTFSHYHLDITPCCVKLEQAVKQVRDSGLQKWCSRTDLKTHAVATPVAGLLREYMMV